MAQAMRSCRPVRPRQGTAGRERDAGIGDPCRQAALMTVPAFRTLAPANTVSLDLSETRTWLKKARDSLRSSVRIGRANLAKGAAALVGTVFAETLQFQSGFSALGHTACVGEVVSVSVFWCGGIACVADRVSLPVGGCRWRPSAAAS